MRLFIMFAWLTVLVFPTGRAGAQQFPTGSLPEMVVTATAEPTAEQDLPVHVQVVGREEIQRSGAETLDQVLLNTSPDTVLKYPGAYTDVRIRGFRSYNSPGANMDAKVLVLIDGTPAGTGNLSLIPLGNVERIEIMRGPGSVLYGGSAMGGVINVITKKGRGDASGNAAAEYGSFDHSQARFSLSGGLENDRLGYAFAARRFSRGDYRSGGNDRYPNTGYDDVAASAALTWRLGSENSVHLFANHFSATHVGNAGPEYLLDDDAYVDDTHRRLAVTYDGEHPDRDLAWRISGWMTEHEYTDHDTAFYSKSAFNTLNTGVKAQTTLPAFKTGRLTLGGQYNLIREKRSGTGIYAPDSDYRNWAVFAENSLDAGDFTLIGSLRYDSLNLSTESNDGVAATGDDESMDHLSWRAGLTWWALDWMSVRACAGSAFASPPAYKYSGQYQLWGANYIGNPNLEPESSITWEGGLDIVRGGMSLAMTYFYTDFRDAFADAQTTVNGDPNWYTWINADGRILSGLEVFADYTHDFSLGENTLTVNPYVNLTWYARMREQDEDLTESRGTDAVLGLSEYSVTPGLNLGYNDLLNLNVNAAWHGPQDIHDWDPGSKTYTRIIGKGSFMVYNARLTVNPTDRVRAYLAVDNLGDETYSYVNGYPMPGRSFVGGLEYRF